MACGRRGATAAAARARGHDSTRIHTHIWQQTHHLAELLVVDLVQRAGEVLAHGERFEEEVLRGRADGRQRVLCRCVGCLRVPAAPKVPAAVVAPGSPRGAAAEAPRPPTAVPARVGQSFPKARPWAGVALLLPLAHPSSLVVPTPA